MTCASAMSTSSVPFATTMAATAVRGCSTNIAKRVCTNIAFVSCRHKEFFRIQGNLAKRSCSNLAFVPQHKETQERDIDLLQEFLSPSKKLLVLTGAGAFLYLHLFGIFTDVHFTGISTESGIPDYRSEGVGLYATSSKRPIQHKTFMESKKARQSYWAR